MRIGVFHGVSYHLRYYEDVLAELARRGHHIVLSTPSDRTSKAPPALRGSRHVALASYPAARADGLDETIRLLRTARDYARYLTPALSGAYANRMRALERLRQAAGNCGFGAALLERVETASPEPEDIAALERFFRDAESMIPPDSGLQEFMRANRLDVVIVVSRLNIGATQSDVVAAAKSLGIPCGLIVYSWDNLSNKGLLHVHPDRLFVWNDVQAREAVELHGVSREAIVVTGAPRFDTLFGRSAAQDRDGLLQEAGLDPLRRTVLYLGSTAFVASREPTFVDDWIRAIRHAPDSEVAHANILVRPHPGAIGRGEWSDWSPAGDGVAIAALGDDKEQTLVDQVVASDAVVGLNTSAEIEAAILDKPVLTVRLGELAPGQEGSTHYGYLLAADGGFVQESGELSEHIGQLTDAVHRDPLAPQRRRFVKDFVRPRGADVPAGPILVAAIEALAPRRRRFLGRS
jgi:hypothetical protein